MWAAQATAETLAALAMLKEELARAHAERDAAVAREAVALAKAAAAVTAPASSAPAAPSLAVQSEYEGRLQAVQAAAKAAVEEAQTKASQELALRLSAVRGDVEQELAVRVCVYPDSLTHTGGKGTRRAKQGASNVR
jgi:hypothetical protein